MEEKQSIRNVFKTSHLRADQISANQLIIAGGNRADGVVWLRYMRRDEMVLYLSLNGEIFILQQQRFKQIK